MSASFDSDDAMRERIARRLFDCSRFKGMNLLQALITGATPLSLSQSPKREPAPGYRILRMPLIGFELHGRDGERVACGSTRSQLVDTSWELYKGSAERD